MGVLVSLAFTAVFLAIRLAFVALRVAFWLVRLVLTVVGYVIAALFVWAVFPLLRLAGRGIRAGFEQLRPKRVPLTDEQRAQLIPKFAFDSRPPAADTHL